MHQAPVTFLAGGGLGSGVHPVLRDFVDAARRRLLMDAVEMIERTGSFSDRESFFDGFGDIGLGEENGIAKGASAGQLRGNGRSERAARTVRVLRLHVVAAEREDFDAVEE